MPIELRKGDLALQPGYFDQVCDFYAVSPALDATGAPVDPASAAVAPTLVYTLFANVSKYQGQETRDALTKLGEVWATISIRYFPSRIPVEGMRVKHRLASEEYEIISVDEVSFARTKIELTCRLIR